MASEQARQLRFREVNRDQFLLRTVDVERLIVDDHAARRIWKVVCGLDLSEFTSEQRVEEGKAGRPAYRPELLVSIWLYAYSIGVGSAREIERRMEYEPGFAWLSGMEPISHHTLSDFRVEHGQALRSLFQQVLGLMLARELITLERMTVDGTKIRANVSKKSFTRKSRIEESLRKASEHLREVEAGSEKSEETAKRQAARKRAAAQEQQRLTEALAEIENLRAQRRSKSEKEPVVSHTEPGARMMRTHDGGVAPCYNAQIVTDAAHTVIVDAELVQDAEDSVQLTPALDRVESKFGKLPRQMLGDAGYCRQQAIIDAADRGTELIGRRPDVAAMALGKDKAQGNAEGYSAKDFLYDSATVQLICPQGHGLHHKKTLHEPGGSVLSFFVGKKAVCSACPARQLCCPKAALVEHGRIATRRTLHPAVAAFDQRMREPANQLLYRVRSAVAEFPHACLKQRYGLRRFLTRGRHRCQSELLWGSLAFNFAQMFRLCPDLGR